MRASIQGEYIVIDSDNAKEDEIRKYRDALNLRVVTFSCSPTLNGGIDKFGILIAPDNNRANLSWLRKWLKI